MVMKVTEGEASFNSEEQNEPINPEDCVFNEEWFDYYNEAEMDFKDKDFQFFGFVESFPLEKTKKSEFFCDHHIGEKAKLLVTCMCWMRILNGGIRIVSSRISWQKERWLKRDFGRGYQKVRC